MKPHNHIAIFVFIQFAFSVINAVAEDDPMNLFRSIEGTWEMSAEYRPSQANPTKSTGKGEFSGKMILGSHFFQVDGYMDTQHDGRKNFQAIISFDEKLQAFHRWYFRSDGVTAESKGTWNPKTKILTWTSLGLSEDTSIVVNAKVSKDRIEEKIIGKKDDGTVLADVTIMLNRKR